MIFFAFCQGSVENLSEEKLEEAWLRAVSEAGI